MDKDMEQVKVSRLLYEVLLALYEPFHKSVDQTVLNLFILEVMKCCIALDTSCQGVDVYQGLELYKDTVQTSMELIKRLSNPKEKPSSTARRKSIALDTLIKQALNRQPLGKP